MSKPLKYTREQMEGFLAYAKEHNIGILKMLDHFKINRRTFYMTAHRYDMNTDGVRVAQSFNTRAMSDEQVRQILDNAKAKRISHRKSCAEFGLSYNTFRGAIVRLKVKAERFSSTYSKEDVQKALDYAQANHMSLAKACASLGFKYNLLAPSAKRYKMKKAKNEEIFPEAKDLSDKEFVAFYLAKGYVANEIFHVLKKMNRKVSRGMVYYYCNEQSGDRIQAKIDKLKERIEGLEGSQKLEVPSEK